MNNSIILKLMARDIKANQLLMLKVITGTLAMGMLFIFINTNLIQMFESTSMSFIAIALIMPYVSEIKNKSIWVHTVSLPIRRSDMVKSRYAFMIPYATSLLVIWSIIYILILNGTGADPKYALTIEVFLDAWFRLMLLIGVFLFPYYRLNLIWSTIFYSMVLIIPALIRTAEKQLGLELIETFKSTYFLGSVSIVLLILSYLSSVTFFKTRDI